MAGGGLGAWGINRYCVMADLGAHISGMFTPGKAPVQPLEAQAIDRQQRGSGRGLWPGLVVFCHLLF